MRTTLLTDLTVKEICEGFVYNQLEGKGLFGWSGKLTIQPEYLAGVPLNKQELLNATYSGTFVTKAKEVFSNSRSPQLQKWGCYVSGNANRQDILHAALAWVAKGED